MRIRNSVTAATPCNSDFGVSGEYFVGITNDPGETDYAGSLDSAVLGGGPNFSCSTASSIGGGSENTIATAATSAYDGYDFIGAGYNNQITGAFAFAGDGIANTAQGQGSFVGAGGTEQNAVYQKAANGMIAPGSANFSGGTDSFVGAGDLNAVSGNGSFIGAGGFSLASTGTMSYSNQVSGTDSFIGAGDQNAVSADESFIGSGSGNVVGSGSTYATILGGNRNRVSAEYASIIGGFGNAATGAYAIVAGGDTDTAAGIVSFAAGYHADAAHNGSFVWSDYVSGSTVVKDSAANQYVARASGGVRFFSNEGATSGVELTPGSGTWASLSDRSAKTAIVPLDDDAILAKVSALPVDSWQYTSEKGVRHVGPMAQDFYAAFGTGADNRHITSIDEDGVALAAIKALARKDREIGELHSDVVELRAEVRRLEDRVASK